MKDYIKKTENKIIDYSKRVNEAEQVVESKKVSTNMPAFIFIDGKAIEVDEYEY